MRLLIDQHTPLRAAAMLRAAGIDCYHVREIGMTRASDLEIIARAVADDRTIVTYDADFHALLATTGAVRPSVIRIRIQGLASERFFSVVRPLLERLADRLAEGVAVSVTLTKAAVRDLPL